MATLGANDMTISDAVRRQTVTGQIAEIAELLNQAPGLIQDLNWKEGDQPGGHQVTYRTSLPTISTVVVGNGTQSSKSTTGQTLESFEILEGYSVIDEKVANYGGDPGGKRASEDVAFVEQFHETVADRWFYGNSSTTIGQMNGLTSRYASTTGGTGSNVILGGGAGSDNMSIWLCGFGPRALYGIYPKGTPGGLATMDWGKQVRTNGDGTEQVVYRTQYTWSIGQALHDWRYTVRIPNVDKSLLVAGTGADLFDKLIMAVNVCFDINMVRPSIYMNRTTRMMFDIQARNDVLAGGQLKYEMVGGKRMEFFQNIPITLCDRLTEAETLVA
jgi:hypothetical protein